MDNGNGSKCHLGHRYVLSFLWNNIFLDDDNDRQQHQRTYNDEEYPLTRVGQDVSDTFQAQGSFNIILYYFTNIITPHAVTNNNYRAREVWHFSSPGKFVTTTSQAQHQGRPSLTPLMWIWHWSQWTMTNHDAHSHFEYNREVFSLLFLSLLLTCLFTVLHICIYAYMRWLCFRLAWLCRPKTVISSRTWPNVFLHLNGWRRGPAGPLTSMWCLTMKNVARGV